MAILGWLLGGNDRELAATKYAGRQSATNRAAGKAAKRTARNLLRHHNGGAARAAATGQRWEAQQHNYGGQR
jgi:hypothetical protein